MRRLRYQAVLTFLLLHLILKKTCTAAAAASSPVTNWDSSWTASSIQGTVIVVPCTKTSLNNNEGTSARLIVLSQGSSSSSSSTLPFTLLDRAFVAWTGFAVDVESLTHQLLQHTDDRCSIYNQGSPHVAAFVASCVRQDAMYCAGRPYAVQALVIQRQHVWTIDPSGACTLWNSGATASGRDAAEVRKKLHAALMAHGTATLPSVTQALRIALQALPENASQKRIPRAFLVYDEKKHAENISVETIDPELVQQQQQLLQDEQELPTHDNNSESTR